MESKTLSDGRHTTTLIENFGKKQLVMTGPNGSSAQAARDEDGGVYVSTNCTEEMQDALLALGEIYL